MNMNMNTAGVDGGDSYSSYGVYTEGSEVYTDVNSFISEEGGGAGDEGNTGPLTSGRFDGLMDRVDGEPSLGALNIKLNG